MNQCLWSNFFLHHFDAKQMADDSRDESANCPALKITHITFKLWKSWLDTFVSSPELNYICSKKFNVNDFTHVDWKLLSKKSKSSQGWSGDLHRPDIWKKYVDNPVLKVVRNWQPDTQNKCKRENETDDQNDKDEDQMLLSVNCC